MRKLINDLLSAGAESFVTTTANFYFLVFNLPKENKALAFSFPREVSYNIAPVVYRFPKLGHLTTSKKELLAEIVKLCEIKEYQTAKKAPTFYREILDSEFIFNEQIYDIEKDMKKVCNKLQENNIKVDEKELKKFFKEWLKYNRHYLYVFKQRTGNKIIFANDIYDLFVYYLLPNLNQ